MGGVSRGAANGNWKGGRIVDPRGYVLIRVGKNHPLADVRGYAYEHRLVAQEAIGRDLCPGEEVHHKSELKGLNGPADLKVARDRAEHQSWHRKRDDLRPYGADNPEIDCACGCGSRLQKYDAEGRPRRFVSGHNQRGKGGKWAKRQG